MIISYKPLSEIAEVDWGNTKITKSSYMDSKNGFPAYSAAGQDGVVDWADHEGDGVVLSAIGARCGRCFRAKGKWTAIKNTIVIKPKKGIDPDLLFYFLNDENRWEISGSGQPFITLKTARNLPIPVFAPDVQNKLATKIIKLFTEIDLATEELQKTKQRLELYKHSILNAAISGQLVPQDPNDEPASKLLERIRAEKEKLIKEKKIKKEKPLPPIDPSEVPFELPNGWQWVRLSDLGVCGTGTTPETKFSEYYNGNIHFYKPADFGGFFLDKSEHSITQKGLENGRQVPSNSVLMVCIGATIGKLGITRVESSCNQQVNYITPIFVDPEWIATVLKSQYFFQEVWSRASGNATPIVNRTNWERILVPIGPTNETKKIFKLVFRQFENAESIEKLIDEKLIEIYLCRQSILKSAFEGKLI